MAQQCVFPGCREDATEHATIVSGEGEWSEIHSCSEHVGELPHYPLSYVKEVESEPAEATFESCSLHSMFYSERTPYSFRIVLKSEHGESILVFDTGYVEGVIIHGYLQKRTTAYRLTHQLLLDVVQALGAVPAYTCVTGYDRATRLYRCLFQMKLNEEVVSVNCRISDAVALLVCESVLLLVNSELLRVSH